MRNAIHIGRQQNDTENLSTEKENIFYLYRIPSGALAADAFSSIDLPDEHRGR